MRFGKFAVVLLAVWAVTLITALPNKRDLWGNAVAHAAERDKESGEVNKKLAAVLATAGFTGRIESTLTRRLGRRLDPELVEAGRLLFFDNVLGLHEDNSCAGCHSPAFSFGDSQSITIGTDNNGFVGASRIGPRNQRKAPLVTNSAFYRRLMLNGRFEAKSGDPFDNSEGFKFPPPEGDAVLFGAGDNRFPTLLAAAAHLPVTEAIEMAGFTGARTNATINSLFDEFDDGHGNRLPKDKNRNGFLNEELRDEVVKKVNKAHEYVARFSALFAGPRNGRFQVTFPMIGIALAEFQTSLTLANAPIDRFARGEHQAMTASEKRGALLFFGKAGCVTCHAVKGRSLEMFSDFENHVLGVPQIAPIGFGPDMGNVVFDGPGADEDFGAAQVTGDPADLYKFRSSPLRNVALQAAFFHNGAFTRLEDAIRHHLNVIESARRYHPQKAGVDQDLAVRMGPIEPLLDRLDPLVAEETMLSRQEFDDLLMFVRDGLLDPRAKPRHSCKMVPHSVPSGIPVLFFEGCQSAH